MDMTVAMFDAHYNRAPAIRALRMMDTGQATVYAQVTGDGRRKLWNSWTQIRSRISHMMNLEDRPKISNRSILTWNGEPVSIKFIKRRFRSMFGKRSVEGARS